MSEPFRFAAALSTAADAATAVQECSHAILAALNGPPDLLIAFYTHHFGPEIESIPNRLVGQLQPKVFLGATGESIVGNGREIETSAALSVWGARLPGVEVAPLRLEFARTPEGPTILGWPESVAGEWPAGSALLVLGEPFSFPADWLLERLNEDCPGVPVVGGMASGGRGPGQNRVAVGNESFPTGAVGVLLRGPIEVRTVVSQGCRPIGESFVVTQAEHQMIQSLGGRPPLAYLQELFETLPERDRELVNQGLHVGRVINEYQDSFGRGDFLIRNVVGVDRAKGGVAAADFFKRGQTVQFHVRDAVTADEDLREMLSRAAQDFQPEGGLLFTCNGRGSRLFEVPDHDAAAVQSQFAGLPVAGFFAQGELGPVGGKNFMHGFTASLALFARKEASGG
jgi:small ligand-binding sensory domain FIST